jgi:hypothetical protein
VILGLAFGSVVGLAYVGFVSLFLRAPNVEREPCEVIEVNVLLNALEFVRVPGMDNEAEGIPFPGAITNYTRLSCNGVEFLVRSDALGGVGSE